MNKIICSLVLLLMFSSDSLDVKGQNTDGREWEIWFPGSKDFIKWALQQLLAVAKPIVIIAETLQTRYTNSQKFSGVITLKVDSGYVLANRMGTDGTFLVFHLNSYACIRPFSISIKSISFWLCVRQKNNWA